MANKDWLEIWFASDIHSYYQSKYLNIGWFQNYFYNSQTYQLYGKSEYDIIELLMLLLRTSVKYQG